MHGLVASPRRLWVDVKQRSQWQWGCLTAALHKRLGGVATWHISRDNAQLSCLHSSTLNTNSFFLLQQSAVTINPMSTSIETMTPTLPAKRKRAHISYAEMQDESFDSAYESGDDMDIDDADSDLAEGDTVYGSRKVKLLASITTTCLTSLTETGQIERTKEDAFYTTKTKEAVQTVPASITSS
jgi:hypothetical protein